MPIDFLLSLSFKYNYSIYFLVNLALSLAYFFLYRFFFLAIKSFFYCISDTDYFAILYNIFGKLHQKLLFGRGFELFFFLGLKSLNALLIMIFCIFFFKLWHHT